LLLGHSFLPSLCLVCFKYGFCFPLSLSLSLCPHVFLILWHPMERERKNIPWREKIKYQKLRESSKQENEKIAQLSYVDSLRWSSSTAFLLFSHSTNHVFSFLFCFGVCTSRLILKVPSSPLLLQDFPSLYFHLLFVLYIGELFFKLVTSNLVVYVYLKKYIFFLYFYILNLFLML
jgi:hypothetical protein